MSPIGLVLDTRFERHVTGPGHPECPARLESIRRRLDAVGLVDRCILVEPERAGDDVLQRVHDPAYVRRVADVCASGARLIDSADTAVCEDSAEIARLAAGALVSLCRRVARGGLHRGFAAVRPPGHHAERDTAMGFCLFNNVAVAARAVQDSEGIERVLIVDWDVHHGNGTQHLFEDDPTVLYFSVHQMPLYPGTGAATERGTGKGEGTTVNCPLPPGADDEAFLGKLRQDLSRASGDFLPDFVLVSAGFDAHEADPLAQLQVSTEAYGEATAIVSEIAVRHAGGRLVSVLEGGYDLAALAESVDAHLTALLSETASA